MRGCRRVSVCFLFVSLVSLPGCGSNLMSAEEMTQREEVTGTASPAGASRPELRNTDCLRQSAPAAGVSQDVKTRGGPGGEPLPPCGVPTPPIPAGPVLPPPGNPGQPGVPGQPVPEPIPPATLVPPPPGGPAPCAGKWGCKIGKLWGNKGGAFGGKGGFWGGKQP